MVWQGSTFTFEKPCSGTYFQGPQQTAVVFCLCLLPPFPMNRWESTHRHLSDVHRKLSLFIIFYFWALSPLSFSFPRFPRGISDSVLYFVLTTVSSPALSPDSAQARPWQFPWAVFCTDTCMLRPAHPSPPQSSLSILGNTAQPNEKSLLYFLQ